MKAALGVLMLLASLAVAHAFGLGLGDRLGKLGVIGGVTAFVPPPSCASPTAPNGVIDLSQCSNASYAAVIF